MPLNVPVSKDDLSKAVWEYAARILSSLATPNEIVKFVGKGTGTEVPSNKSLYDLLALDRLDNATYGLNALRSRIVERLTKADFEIVEFEKGFSGDEYFYDIAVTTPNQSLGSATFNVALPTGASIRFATAIAIIEIMNDAATLQKVDLDLEVDGTNVFSRDDVVGLPAVDGSSASFLIVQNVSAIITSPGNHTLEAKTTLSDAHSTHFTTQYMIIVAYRMS